MLILLSRRLGQMVLVMLVVSVLLFLALEVDVHNVARKVIGQFATDAQVNIWLEDNGYNRAIYVRYFEWLGNVLQGDFGRSVRFRTEVSDLLWPRLGNTAILGGITLFFVTIFGFGAGIIAGMKEGSWLDRTASFISIFTTSIPEFASATFLSAIFVFLLGWLPGTSSMIFGWTPVELILPVAVLTLYDFGLIARMTRASMAEVMTSHYIRTAVLKGLPYRQVIMRHALRNALIAPFTVLMLQINWLLSGVIVVEVFYAYKGFGALLLDAALNDDIYLLEACTLVSVFVVVATQVISDVSYTYLNPRIRFS